MQSCSLFTQLSPVHTINTTLQRQKRLLKNGWQPTPNRCSTCLEELSEYIFYT
eukprot:m.146813 g.146813  ORF g.146813 m.146813 type:complete len:53 (+) comp14159_c0_seq1:4565-4723(+)